MKLVKLFAVLLALTMFTAACSPSQPAASPDASQTPGNQAEAPQDNQGEGGKKYKIATVVKLVGIGWFDRMEEGVKKYAADTGHDTFLKGPPKADAAMQVQIVEDLIAQDVDAICIVPFSPEAVEPVLKKARDKGIVVISHEAEGMQNVDFDLEAVNNYDYGAYLMDALAKSMGEEGEYATSVGSLTSKSQNQWEEGGVQRQLEKYPKMKAVERKIETYDEQKIANEKMKELLKKYPNLKGFQGATSQDAPGAALAVEEAGLIGKISVVGTSMVSICAKFLESGAMDTAALWDPADAGYAMNVMATMILDGKKDEIKDGVDLGVKGYNSLKQGENNILYGDAFIAVTKENMADYDF